MRAVMAGGARPRSRSARTRCWDSRPRRWRTWGSMSTGAAGPGGAPIAETGEYVLLADRWHTCFFDLSGDQGLLGQVEGRTADDAAYWLAQAPAAWRDAIEVVAIDMCSIYASAVRRALPHAQLVVDLFHVVQLAVKMTGDVRRRAVREKYGRRGRSGDAEYGVKGLLVRNLEHLRPEQFAKVMDTLGADRHGQEIAAAWIGKEKLRDALNLRARVTGSAPCERDVRGRLASFYDWCAQNDDIAELLTLARTISKWEDEIVAAVLTGVTNARSESPEQARETGSPHGLFLPQSREPAPPCPDRLHPDCPAIPGRHTETITSGNRTATRPRLTSKSRISEVPTSRFPGFHKSSLEKRLEAMKTWADLSDEEIDLLRDQGLGVELASQMIENVIGTLEIPLGVAPNLVVNTRQHVVPMAIEEASVIAAASHGAKLSREGGGFQARAADPITIGQIQILDIPSVSKAQENIAKNKTKVLELANQDLVNMVRRGGGAVDVSTRVVNTSSGQVLVVHVLFDTRDAMGANIVNSRVEAIAPMLAGLSAGRVNLRILSNQANHRPVIASCQISVKSFGIDGKDVSRKIVEASDLAAVDSYRAVTHNKGIMNAIDAVCLATGNDWRAVESAAHAYAAQEGGYRSLSSWRLNDSGNVLLGQIELPVPVGIVGGATRAHPVSRVALKILAVKSATELAEVMAAVGLAENLASLRALVSEGIQKGHMRLHAGQIALTANADEKLAARRIYGK